MSDPPRITPGTGKQAGLLNAAINVVLAQATGGRPLNLFTTLARSRGLFRRWLFFASGLMPFGTLPRSDTELVILRVAHNTRCEYEFDHHTPLARKVGLSEEEIAWVRRGPDAEEWCLGCRGTPPTVPPSSACAGCRRFCASISNVTISGSAWSARAGSELR